MKTYRRIGYAVAVSGLAAGATLLIAGLMGEREPETIAGVTCLAVAALAGLVAESR